MMKNDAKVSVIIPFFNQARFLGDALDSLRAQSRPACEVIVIDDGSKEDCAAIVKRFADTRLIRQTNRGLSAARNAGLAASSGEYLIFLDADDRLLSNAIECGVECLRKHNACGFCYGRYRMIDCDGAPTETTPVTFGRGQHAYIDFLRRNFVGMHATVMYRRSAFDAVGCFDTSLRGCEDYDLYLRMSRRFPIAHHEEVIAEYRQHDSNMSRNDALMLKSSLNVLAAQRAFVRDDKRYREAYRDGVQNFRKYYGNRLIRSLGARIETHDFSNLLTDFIVLARYYPGGLVMKLLRKFQTFSKNFLIRGERKAGGRMQTTSKPCSS